MIREITNEDYQDVIALSEYAFQYKVADHEMTEVKRKLDMQYILGDFEENKLIAKLHVYPLQVKLKNQVFKMGGVASVATWPEARRNRKVASLLNESLHWMNNEGYDISYLHPFSVPFYRKFGWEMICSEKSYTISKEDLIFIHSSNGSFIRKTKEEALSSLMNIYEFFSEKYNGLLIRDQSWWQDVVLKKAEHAIIHVNDQRQEDGYMLYTVKDRELIVHEVVVLNESTKKDFWNFICQHDSMVSSVKWKTHEEDRMTLFIPNPRVKTEIHPYFMGRIVNIIRFFEKYPFYIQGEDPLILHLSDPICTWNNGTFFLQGNSIKTFQKEKGSCTNPPKKGLIINIGTLTSILLGHSDPQKLFEIGMIQGEEQQVILLKEMLPSQGTSVLFDFF
ncbi:GNAT family N-acetyltransferase [uncultured Metabacillus sp.]|uniref:GNAT family N-acetyltransferase n=1 Tax=uncultured Metabacillus sp. TaxID=2860135 RepID=UPI0026189385|nr:GNAT family N-acetyltransferase [uncultured Metabacillus sp.]